MLFSGQVMRGGLFWVLFWAVAKEYLARGARPAMPNKSTPTNISQRNQKKLPMHSHAGAWERETQEHGNEKTLKVMKPRGHKNVPTLLL